MGRKKEKVYIYNEEGRFIAEFKSESEMSEFYKIDNNYMSRNRGEKHGEDVVMLYNMGLYACNYKIGRDRLRTYLKKCNSKFIRQNKSKTKDKNIGMFNMNNDLICVFKDAYYAEAIIGYRPRMSKVFYNDFRFEYI